MLTEKQKYRNLDTTLWTENRWCDKIKKKKTKQAKYLVFVPTLKTPGISDNSVFGMLIR